MAGVPIAIDCWLLLFEIDRTPVFLILEQEMFFVVIHLSLLCPIIKYLHCYPKLLRKCFVILHSVDLLRNDQKEKEAKTATGSLEREEDIL